MRERTELKSGQPRHEQVSNWIRECIGGGVFSALDQLPSESQLVERFGVSRITIRRALQTLEAEGMIYRRQGLGSFVQDKQVSQGLVRMTDFAEDMQAAGLQAESIVQHWAPEMAEARVAERLGIDEGAPVMRLDRLRTGDSEPIAFDRTWLPMFFAQLLDGHDLSRETIYRILERDFGIRLNRGRFRIEAANAPADIGQALSVPWGRALLLIERQTYTDAGRCVYFQQRYYRNDRVAYELELSRNAGSGEGMPIREFEPVFKKG